MTSKMHRRLERLETSRIGELAAALDQAITRAEVAEQERDQAALWLHTQAVDLEAVRRELAATQRRLAMFEQGAIAARENNERLREERGRTEAALFALCLAVAEEIETCRRAGDSDDDTYWHETLRALGLWREPAAAAAQQEGKSRG